MIETIMSQVATGLLRLPQALLSLLAGAPVERDGQSLDTQTQVILRLLAVGGGKALHELEPAAARALYDQMAGLLSGGVREMADTEKRYIAAEGGDIPVRVYTPRSGAAPRPAVVYYHGGGWVIGSLDGMDGVCTRLADETGAVVVSVDYRLAPEHVFPAAAEDAVAAFRWVREHAAELGVDPARIAVAGDSAGGNLAAVVAQQLRGQEGPCFQLLVYPVTDVSAEGNSYELFADGFYLTADGMRWFRNLYLPDPGAVTDVRVSPLLAEDLDGVAPAMVLTAGFDVLRDEGRAYAERLLDGGVEVDYRNYPGLIHGFFSMAGAIDGADRAFSDATSATARAFSGAGRGSGR